MKKLKNPAINEQSLRFLESLIDPALITSADNEVSIANLALETLLDSHHYRLEDLFTPNDLEKLGDLRTWNRRHTLPQSLRLRAHPERPLTVTIQRAHFLTGEYYLLVFRDQLDDLDANAEAHQVKTSQKEELEVRVLKQTAK